MKNVCFLVLGMISCNLFATTVEETTITKVLAGHYYGNRVFIEIENKLPIASSHCHKNTKFSYSFDPSSEAGKVTMSIVLAAYASGSKVLVNGYDTCNGYGGVEDLRQVLLFK